MSQATDEPNRHMATRRRGDTTEDAFRLFVAVPVPDAVKRQHAAIVEQLRIAGIPARWSESELAHITLHFIGDTEPEMAELLRLSLGVAISGHSSFQLRTAQPGAFPSIRRPRVLWLGLWGPTHRLESIYNDIGDFLDEFGCDIEEATFHPHITLGRIRNSKDIAVSALPDKVRQAFAAMESDSLVGEAVAESILVDRVQLVRSHLERTGPRYEVLAEYQLANESSE